MKRDISPERARELFNYCSETGRLYWKEPGKRKNPTGTKTHQGYLVTFVDGVQVKIHRIIWAICCGDPGDFFVDHINRSRTDNRIGNLRLCTNQQNLKNTAVTNAKGRHIGVRWLTHRNKWAARITHNGKSIHLGCFNSFEAAREARAAAILKFGGEFAPLELRA